MKRRNLILLLGGASSGALSVGTGAFSGVEADRDVEVNVVKDEKAYLGLKNLTENEDGDDEIVPSGTKTEAVRISNRFTSELELTITLNDRGEIVDQVIVGEQLEIGEKKQVNLAPGGKTFVAVTCNTTKTKSTGVSLSFVGDASSVTVDTERTFEFTCEGAAEDNVSSRVMFLNNGKVKIHTESGDDVHAKAYIRGPGQSGNGPVESTGFYKQSLGKELAPKDFQWENNGDEIVGVGIKRIGVFTRKQAGEDGVVSESAVVSANEAFTDEDS